MTEHSRDSIYANQQPPADFVFDERVAAVFNDMINRSVPGYATIVSMSGALAERYCQHGSRVYDLGCSLGGTTLAMAHHIKEPDYRLIAVDNSQAMMDRFGKVLAGESADIRKRVELVCDDINNVVLEDTSVVTLNFTLQFIAPEQRQALITRIHNALRPGGVLILSEKIRFPEPELNDLFIDMYHQFKKVQGYSDLEISQKRQALERVLVPETIDTHKQRCREAGFRSCDVWFQCFNFASLVAFR